MALSSFSSGALVSSAGWEAMNATALVLLLVVVGAVAWYARQPKVAPAKAA